MTLVDALEVREGDVVAFIGAGGKTTAMYRVAEELAARGLKVIVTTTTKIFPPNHAAVVLVLAGGDAGGQATRAGEALRRADVVAVAARTLPDGKLQGIEPEAVASLRAVTGVAAVLVEADGSARKPFKAPADHEPVIPRQTTLLVAVVGADALGRPLAGDIVHRPELAAQQAGIRMGDPITPEAAARVILGPANLKGRPAAARLAALIARARTAADHEAAYRLARLLQQGGASPVVIAELVAEPVSISVLHPSPYPSPRPSRERE